jgi:hypothetical protein
VSRTTAGNPRIPRRIIFVSALVIAVVALGGFIALQLMRATADTAGPVPSSTSTPLAQPTAAPPVVEGEFDESLGDDVAGTATGEESAAFSDGLGVRISSVEPTTVEGAGVGQTSGDAIVVDLAATNSSAKAIDLGAVTVNAYAGEARVPLEPTDSTAFRGSLAAAQSASASYGFRVPDDAGTIWVTVSTGPDSGVVVLEYGEVGR